MDQWEIDISGLSDFEFYAIIIDLLEDSSDYKTEVVVTGDDIGYE